MYFHHFKLTSIAAIHQKQSICNISTNQYTAMHGHMRTEFCKCLQYWSIAIVDEIDESCMQRCIYIM